MIDLVGVLIVLEFPLFNSDGDYLPGVVPTGIQKQINLNGAGFGTPLGTFSEVGAGWYRYVSTAGEATGARTVALKIAGAVGGAGAAARTTIVREHISGGIAIADNAITDTAVTAGAAAKIAQAVRNVAIIGTYTQGDMHRLNMAMLAGPVTDFTTGTQVYRCPVTNKIRATITTTAAGRTAVTLGDLT